METKPLELLAKRLNLTNSEIEPEPYILTPEEESAAIAWEIEQLKKHEGWKMRQFDFSELEIMSKISQVEWEKEINREEVLNRANSNKNYEVWQKQQREKEKLAEIEKQKELQLKFSAKNMLSLMRWTSENVFGKKLVINNDNKAFITAVCYFLSNDGRFETELGFSFQKGLLIRGISGLGKTHILKCVEKNELNPVLILSMIEITDEVKAEGEYELKLNGNKIIYLDDVGTEEPIVNHFGTKIAFFKNFIESYYLRNKIFNKLIISTNNSFAEIEEKYGFRVRSRMKDMFNVINVSGQDMRGQ